MLGSEKRNVVVLIVNRRQTSIDLSGVSPIDLYFFFVGYLEITNGIMRTVPKSSPAKKLLIHISVRPPVLRVNNTQHDLDENTTRSHLSLPFML